MTLSSLHIIWSLELSQHEMEIYPNPPYRRSPAHVGLYTASPPLESKDSNGERERITTRWSSQPRTSRSAYAAFA